MCNGAGNPDLSLIKKVFDKVIVKYYNDIGNKETTQ